MNDVLIAFTVSQAVFLFIDIYIFLKTGHDIVTKGEYKFFTALIFAHVCYLILNSIWTLQSYGLIHLKRDYAAIVYMGSLLFVTGCSFLFFMFTTERMHFSVIWDKKVLFLCRIPAVIFSVMIFSSIWTGWVFTVDESNLFVHGPAYTMMLVFAGTYLMAVVLIGGYNFITASTRQARKSSAALLTAVLGIILFVILDDFMTRASLLPCAIFAVIVCIFITLQESNINSDALTGMNNRRKADDYLTEVLSGVSPDHPVYLYVADLDGFKGINDAYGHLEGDAALLLCARTIEQAIDESHGFAARYGGDEFILCRNKSDERLDDPEVLVRRVNMLLSEGVEEMEKPYHLSMSMGYSLCSDSSEPLGVCLMRADKMLYQRKRALYQGK